MPKTLEGRPALGRMHPNRRPLILLAVALLVLVSFARTLLAEWVELLWYGSLGYSRVFWTTRLWEALAFVGFALLTFALMYGGLRLLRRVHREDLAGTRSVVLGNQQVQLPVGSVLRYLALGVSLVAAFFSAVSMAAEWPTLALFWDGPQASTGFQDPIFGKPLGFYLFRLPGWELLLDWLLTLSVILCAAAVLYLVLTAGTRALRKGIAYDEPSAWRGLLTAASFLLLLMAAHVFLSRYGLLLEHHTIFDGVTYTDAHVTIGGLLLLSAALVVGAALAALGVVRNAGGRWLALAVVPAVLCFLGLSAVEWYVSGFIVKPNELVRETPYIANNINLTRQAFELDRFNQQQFPAETNTAAAEPDQNQPTLQNIRLWDWHALQDTLRQVQEIRTYYDFPDIDIDRYQVNGTLRQVMLGARELNVDKLPGSSRNWINEKLIYTHGYGATMNTANGFTPEGLPSFLLSNMPVQSSTDSIKIARPEVYFGELTDTDVYVKTRQKEFDYPQGETNNLTTYSGTGGIVLGGFLRKALIALDRGDLGKVPFSDDIGAGSRLLMRRNIRARISELAPFLTLDEDPYLVVGNDGRMGWIQDAYTTTDSFPYATHAQLGDQQVNYVRNSVKVVVDAYDGTTTFYVFDPKDPILAAYRRLLPTLFRDASEMPATERQHVRYPEVLFKLQSAVFGLYHMTDPEVFFNREDLWTVATETRSDSEGNQAAQPMEPNYVLMRLPGNTDEEFVEILPFTPANRNNLIGWVAGRCDGAHYGEAMVYDFPKTRLVDGPQQIEARIDQNAQLSGQLTLWNQQGSHVLRGSLLVIPVGRALLYAEPVYLQAQQSPMPELRVVVLALQDKLAYGPTFQAALSSLFGGEASSLTASEGGPAPTPMPTGGTAVLQPATSVHGLIATASQAFADYQRLTSQGKLAEAGQRLEDLKRALAELNQRQ